MAKRIFDQYRDFTQLLGKYRGYIPPALFCDALYFASRGLYDFYWGKTEQYRVGHPVPPVAYQLTTSVSVALHPFIRRLVVGRDAAKITAGKVVVGPKGQTGLYLELEANDMWAFPEDWQHPTAFDMEQAVEPVQVLDDNEVRGMLSSTVCPPDEAHPMLGIVPAGYKLYAGNLSSYAPELLVQYLGQPRRPVYGLDYSPTDPDAEPTYNDSKSVDVEWLPSRDNQLLTRALEYPALGLRDGVVQQVAGVLKERGT